MNGNGIFMTLAFVGTVWATFSMFNEVVLLKQARRSYKKLF